MNGIILINKPINYTSHDIVNIVRKKVNTKVGHAGTLDPNATGVLPLLIGKGTLISKYLINHDKTYEVTLKLGIKTDTLDSEGKIIEKKEVTNLDKKEIESTLLSFVGKQQQIPPMHSAIKINGKKLYEYARQGKQVEVNPRQIEIYNIKLNNIIEDEINFTVDCSKGTYIRSLCENIAEKLNNIGYMKHLKRTRVGIFNIENAIELSETENLDNIQNKIISIEEIFKDKEKITLDNKKIELLLNGVKININLKDDIYRIHNKENKFIGIGIIKNNLLKRDVII